MPVTTDQLFERYGPAYRWLATFTVMLGTVSMLLSSTAINVALPSIMGAFGIGPSQAAWLSTGFLAATSATMLVNAWAVESFGARGIYMVAMAVFSLGSLLGGLAFSADQIVLARVMQGAMAGLIQPLAMLTLFQVFPPEQRGRGMGIFGFGVVLAPAFGPVVGGVLVDVFSWRAVFLISLPVSLLGIVMAALFLPTRERQGPRASFDRVGFLLLAIGLLSLLYVLTNGQQMGWESLSTIGLLALGVGCGAAFVYWSCVYPKPLLNINVYRSLAFSCGSLLSFVLGIGLFGTMFLVPLMVQEVQGLSATQAGALLLPAGLLMSLMFPVTGRLADLYPPHVPIVWGLLALIVSSLFMRQFDVNTGYWMLLAWILVGRLGIALVMPAASTGSVNGLPPHLLPQGAGTLNFARQLGGAFGINVIALVLERRTDIHAALYAQDLGSATSAWMEDVAAVYARNGVSEQLQSLGALEHLARAVSAQGLTAGFADTFVVLAMITALALVPGLMMARAVKP